MSTAAVSSVSILQELQSFYQTRQTDLKQLGSALKSGDISGAQQAFQALAVLGEGGPFANSEPFGNTNRANAFNAVGEALQAGNLSQAQAAFATLTGSQSSSAVSQTPDAVVNLASTQPSTQATTQDASSIYQQLQAYRQQRKTDVAQLGQDLQAGNLSAAQQDFAALSALGQSGPSKNGQVFQNSTRNQDFQAIGQALQSGDLAGAQSAFANLESTFGKQNQQAQSAISAYNSGVTEIVINFPSTTSTTGTTPPTEPPVTQTSSNSAGANSGAEVVINLGQSSSSASSPTQVEIDLGSNGSGATVSIGAPQAQNTDAKQVTIDLQPQQSYEFVLNFSNSNSASTGQASSGNTLSLSA